MKIGDTVKLHAHAGTAVGEIFLEEEKYGAWCGHFIPANSYEEFRTLFEEFASRVNAVSLAYIDELSDRWSDHGDGNRNALFVSLPAWRAPARLTLCFATGYAIFALTRYVPVGESSVRSARPSCIRGERAQGAGDFAEHDQERCGGCAYVGRLGRADPALLIRPIQNPPISEDRRARER